MVIFLYISPEDEVLFAVFGGMILLSLAVCTLFSIKTAKSDRKFLALANIWILGLNLVLYIAEIAWWIISYEQVRIAEQNGGMEGGLGLFLLIIFYLPHWITYLISRIAASISCRRALTGVCSRGTQTLHTALHLFPIADVISAIWVLYKVNRFQRFQQPPIETQ